MKILIVDDERSSIEYISRNLNAEELSVDQIFTATNILEGKSILQSHQIDVLLCDIEMPLGSGIELVKWTAAVKYPSINIFITCHSDFQFARQAIDLGVFSYILKPFHPEELQNVLRQAAARLAEKYLIRPLAAAAERNLPGPDQEQQLRDLLTGANQPAESKEKYALILCCIPDQQKDTKPVYYFRSRLECLVDAVTEQRRITQFHESDITWIAVSSPSFLMTDDHILAVSNLLLEEFKDSLTVNICYYTCLSESEFCDSFRQVKETCGAGFFLRSGILDKSLRLTREKSGSEIRLPDFNHIQLQLIKGNTTGIMAAINRWEREIAINNTVSRNAISAFSLEFTDIIYKTAEQYCLNGHGLVQNTDFETYRRSQHSLEDFHAYILMLAENFYAALTESQKEKPAVTSVIRFIHEHYCDDITMEDISEHVHLNKDYITKLFQQTNGVTPLSYLTSYRIGQAKKMLLQNQFSISEIASSCGFNSSSYFCKLFRQTEGVSPKDFRKNAHRSE